MLLRAMGRGSISSVLKLSVDAAWILACVSVGFIWLLAALATLSAMGVEMSLGGISRVVTGDPARIVRWTLNGTILGLGVMLVCAQLRGVFETLVTGDPFVPENARRLRSIALILAALEIVRMFIGVLVTPLLQAFGLAGDDGAISIVININLSSWFAVLTLLVLSQVFSEGAALREDQKMTI